MNPDNLKIYIGKFVSANVNIRGKDRPLNVLGVLSFDEYNEMYDITNLKTNKSISIKAEDIILIKLTGRHDGE